MVPHDTTRPLTTGEIAQFCHVTHRTVLKWVASGKLAAYRTPGNHSRVTTDDFIAFLKHYNMPIPQEMIKTPYVPKRILIVDDDKGIVHSIQRTLLLENKYIVEVAYDGFEAGTKFSAFNPDFIILDIRMPGLDGYQVCSIIRKDPRNKHIKILAISGIHEPQEIQRIKDLGADDYVQKPFNNEDLKKKIAQMLE